MVNEFARLVGLYRTRVLASTGSKVEVLMDIEQLGDMRVVPFLLQVLADPCELRQVRMHALKWLRDGHFPPGDRPRVAEAIRQVVSDGSAESLRLQAVMALAEFADVDGVQATLGQVALDAGEAIELRYCAFTSLERAGLTSESVALLQMLSADGVLGSCARHALSLWRSA
jgi:hypothetical protein